MLVWFFQWTVKESWEMLSRHVVEWRQFWNRCKPFSWYSEKKKKTFIRSPLFSVFFSMFTRSDSQESHVLILTQSTQPSVFLKATRDNIFPFMSTGTGFQEKDLYSGKGTVYICEQISVPNFWPVCCSTHIYKDQLNKPNKINCQRLPWLLRKKKQQTDNC